MRSGTLKCLFTSILAIATFGLVAQGQTEVRLDSTRRVPNTETAELDSASDFRDFRKQSERMIIENRALIDRLKEQKSRRAAPGFKERLVELEELNDYMEIRMNTSEMTRTSDWTRFKQEFLREMTDLRNSLIALERDRTDR